MILFVFVFVFVFIFIFAVLLGGAHSTGTGRRDAANEGRGSPTGIILGGGEGDASTGSHTSNIFPLRKPNNHQHPPYHHHSNSHHHKSNNNRSINSNNNAAQLNLRGVGSSRGIHSSSRGIYGGVHSIDGGEGGSIIDIVPVDSADSTTTSTNNTTASVINTDVDKIPICGESDAYSDSAGFWIDKFTFASHNETFKKRHFLGPVSEEIFMYDRVFLTKNCRMHRFTAKTLLYLIDLFRLLRNSRIGSSSTSSTRSSSSSSSTRSSRDELKLVFFGDSATRGIFCGIARILSGSEIYGPTNNAVCGGIPNDPTNWRKGRSGPITYSSMNKLVVGMYLKGLYNISFVYITHMGPNTSYIMRHVMEGTPMDSMPARCQCDPEQQPS